MQLDADDKKPLRTLQVTPFKHLAVHEWRVSQSIADSSIVSSFSIT